MSAPPIAVDLVAQQQHGPGGAAHVVLLAGVVVGALVLLGVSRWRRRGDAATAREQSISHDRSDESAHQTEEE